MTFLQLGSTAREEIRIETAASGAEVSIPRFAERKSITKHATVSHTGPKGSNTSAVRKSGL